MNLEGDRERERERDLLRFRCPFREGDRERLLLLDLFPHIGFPSSKSSLSLPLLLLLSLSLLLLLLVLLDLALRFGWLSLLFLRGDLDLLLVRDLVLDLDFGLRLDASSLLELLDVSKFSFGLFLCRSSKPAASSLRVAFGL